MHLVADIVLVITNIAADSVPSRFLLLIQILTVGEHPHPLVVQTVGFRKIYYVKTNFFTLFRVRDSKKVPLSVAVGINIVL